MSNQLKIDCLSCGYADQLGTGVRNLFKYSKAYGGADPRLTDGDVFRTEVSLKAVEVALIGPEVAQRLNIVKEKLKGLGRADAIENAIAVLGLLLEDGNLSIPDIESSTHFSNGSVKNAIRLLRVNGLIKREGPRRGGRWVVLV